MKAKKLFFKECHLAGRQYHDVDEVWEELHVGTLLELERDLDNILVVLMKILVKQRTICLVTYLQARMRRLLSCSKWDGMTSSSAVSQRLTQRLTTRIRFD